MIEPVFVWVRSRGALAPVQPQVIWDPSIGPKLEIAEAHILKPYHFDWSLEDLIQLHPAPVVEPD